MINRGIGDEQLRKWYDLFMNVSETLDLDYILFSIGFVNDNELKSFIEKYEITNVVVNWNDRKIRFVHKATFWEVKPSPLSYKINRFMYTIDLKGSNKIRPISSLDSYLEWLDSKMADIHEFTRSNDTDILNMGHFNRIYKFNKSVATLSIMRLLSLLGFYFLLFFSFGLVVINKNFIGIVVILLILGTFFILGIGLIADQKDIYYNSTLLFKTISLPVTSDLIDDLILEQKKIVEIQRNYFKFGRNHFIIFYICEKNAAHELLNRIEFNNILRPAIYSSVGYFFFRRSSVIPIVIDVSTGNEYVPNKVISIKQERLLRDLAKDLL